MYNWNTDTKTFKNAGEPYLIWRLEQMINFGLNGRRLDRKLLKRLWKKLNIDPDKKRFLRTLLWKEKS